MGNVYLTWPDGTRRRATLSPPPEKPPTVTVSGVAHISHQRSNIRPRVLSPLPRSAAIFATATSHSTIRNPLGRSRKGICKRWQPSNKRVPQFQALRQIVTQDEISMIEALFSDVETTVSGSLARDTDFCRVDDVLRFRFSKQKKLSPKRGKKRAWSIDKGEKNPRENWENTLERKEYQFWPKSPLPPPQLCFSSFSDPHLLDNDSLAPL